MKVKTIKLLVPEIMNDYESFFFNEEYVQKLETLLATFDDNCPDPNADFQFFKFYMSVGWDLAISGTFLLIGYHQFSNTYRHPLKIPWKRR